MMVFALSKVYWAGPMSGGVMAALLYDYLLLPRAEPLSEPVETLYCCGPELEVNVLEPHLEAGKDEEWP